MQTRDAHFKLENLPWQPGEKILWLGIGNLGRQDDGLGIRLIESLETFKSTTVHFESNYQLNAEDALLISEYDTVIFVDATAEPSAQEPFEIRPIEASQEIAFSTHEMSIGVVIALCDQLYGKKPKTFLLTLPGYSWEICENLTPRAEKNLRITLASISNLLSEL